MIVRATLTDYEADIDSVSNEYAEAKAGADDAGKGIAATVRDMLSTSADKKAVAQFCIDTLARRAERLLRFFHTEGHNEETVKALRKRMISNVSAQWATCIKKECGFAVSFSNRLTPAKAAKGEKYETEVEPYAPTARVKAEPTAEAAPTGEPAIAGVDPRDLAASLNLLLSIHPIEHVMSAIIARSGMENGKVKEVVELIMNKGGALVKPAAKRQPKPVEKAA